jgi:chemotaxis protein MotB
MRLSQILFVTLLASPVVGCVSQGDYDKVIDERNSLARRLDEFGQISEDNSRTIESLSAEKSRLAQQNAQLEASNMSAQQRLEEMQRQLDELSKQNVIPGVTTEIVDGAFVYRVEGDVLFDSGKHALRPRAVDTLKQVSDLLKQHDYKIDIAGHTDTDPVTVTKKTYPNGNIELGAQRAISVWQYLVKEGVPQGRLQVSSHGEWSPIAAGDKAKNRRVEIRVLLSEPQVR